MTPNKARILIVDDDPGLLRLLTIRLTAAGYEVDSAESGDDALTRLPGFQPHMVITDLRMDGMDGMALFEELHGQNPMLPVIIMTAHGTIPDAVEATQRGVFSYLTKPFASEALLTQVKKALRLSGALEPLLNAAPDKAWRRDILTRSAVMETLLVEARRAADSESNVLIHGASGTGKELLAHALHKASQRSGKPFVTVHCSAIPEALCEAEFFGAAKGMLTGTPQGQQGLIAAAHGGTLYLDEIDALPGSFQPKLLNALQTKRLTPIGAQPQTIDVRVISATGHELHALVTQNEFRADLHYFLHIISLKLPALTERREDIPLLAQHFLAQLQGIKRRITGFAPEALELLMQASWPGNVRQLQNVVEQVAALATTRLIAADLVQRILQDKEPGMLAFAEARDRFEREYLIKVLRMTAGNVSRAARLAQRNRTEFYKLLHRYQLDPAHFRVHRSDEGKA